MSTAALVVVALLSGAFCADSRELREVLYVLSAAQLAAPLPMIVSLVARRPLPAASPRVRSVFANAFVVLVMLVSLGAKALR